MTPKPSQKTELFVGIFVFCGLSLLAGLILKFGDFKFWFRDKYPLTVVFPDAGNLVKNAPVRRGGVEIGRLVKDPTLAPGLRGVRVQMVVYQEFHVARESTFQIKTDGIIGDTYVEVTPPDNPSGEMLKPNDEVAGQGGTGFNDLSNTANRVAEKTVTVLEDIKKSLTDLQTAISKINTGLLSEENLTSVRSALKNLDETIKKLDNEVLSPDNVAAVTASIAKIKQAADKFDVALEKAGQAIDTVDRAISQKLSPGLDEFAKAAASFRRMSENLGMVATDMRTAPGLMSALLRDVNLRDDFVRLADNLRRHGVLWYKDDAAKRAAESQPGAKPVRPGLPWKKN